MQAPHPDGFKIHKDCFLLQMTLNKRQSEFFVTIGLTHDISRQKYYLEVNQQTIEKNQGLSKIYQNPFQLYKQLLQIINQTHIDDEGIITFEVMIGKSKSRKIALNTQKVIPNGSSQHLSLINYKIDLLKKEIYQENQKNNLEQQKIVNSLQTIGDLKNQVQIQKKERQELSKEIAAFKQLFQSKMQQNANLGEAVSTLTSKTRQLESQNLKLKSANQQLLSKIRQGRQQLTEMKRQLGRAKDRNRESSEDSYDSEDYEDQSESQSQQQQVVQQKGEIIQIDSMKGQAAHQHNRYYHIQQTSRNRFRMRLMNPKAQRHTYSFIHAFRIFQQRIVFIKTSVAHSKNNAIRLGVCTKKLLGFQNLSNQKQYVGLNFQNCSIRSQGKTIFSRYKLQPRAIVEMKVDLIDNMVAWRIYGNKNERLYAHQQMTLLPQKLQNRQLFLVITMLNSEDLLDIITD